MLHWSIVTHVLARRKSVACAVEGADAPHTSRQERRGVPEMQIYLREQHSLNVVEVLREYRMCMNEYSEGKIKKSSDAAGQSSAGQLSAGESSAGELSAGQLSAGESSAGELSAGELSAGELSTGQLSAEQSSPAENSEEKEKDSQEDRKKFCPIGIYRGESLRELPEEANCVYIVECRDGSYYTGWTNHPLLRLAAHNEGKGAKYTKSRRPVHFVYMETYETKEEAMSREFFIKKMKRPEKDQLIDGL